jgi:tetratricopeptide (TPR) repeat protein
MSARLIVLAALSCFLPVLTAQTPTPSVAPTAGESVPVTNLPVLEKGAVKSQPDLTGEAIVIEKSTIVMRYARDGSSLRTLTVVAHVLSDAGVRKTGIITFPFASLTEALTFDYVRVRKPSGEVVETPTDGAQEVPMPVTQAAPMYSDLRTKQLPVKSLSVGDTLEYQLTIKGTNADSPGAFWHPMGFSDGVPVKEETIELRVPRDLPVLVKSKKVQPAVSDEGGEHVYRWKHETVSEYPKKQDNDKTAQVEVVQEMYDPDIVMTSFRSWAEVGAWYRGLMKDRAVPDAAIQAKADELTHGLTTDDAKVDALYHYVATQYRYIAVSFGIGRLQPHMASEVFRNQYGDCKDKHTLLEAMLAAEKIEAEPVLIGSGVRVNEALPIPSQFDHVITLVRLKDRDVWLDATPEVAPSRMLLAGLRDKLALAIPATGDARLVRTAATLPFPSFARETITGQLDTHGVLTAHFDLTLRGDAEVMYRSVFHEVARAQWQELEQRVSNANGFAGDVSAVDASLPEKTADPFHVSWDYTRKDFGDWPNRRFPGMSTWFDAKIADDATAPKRTMALDATGETAVHVKLTLPEGYTVTVPPDVKRSTAFAEYTSTYVLKDRMLEMDRTLRYKARELPVSEFGAYRDFVKGMSDDSSQMIQLVGASAKGTTTADSSQAGELMTQVYKEIHAHNYKSARELLNKVRTLNDQQTLLWGMYGVIDWESNKTQAIADYKKEIELHPGTLFVYKELTNLYTGEGRYSDAEQTLQAWAKADPADAQPHARLGSLRLRQKQYKDAEVSYNNAIALSTESDQLKAQLGQAQLKAGDTDAGKTTLHALMDKSEDVNVLNSAAYYMGDAGLDLAASEAVSQRSVQILETRTAAVTLADAKNEDFANTSGLAAYWDTLGWICFKENKLPQAESYARSAWMLLPTDPEAGRHLGMIYEAEGKKDAALTTYRLAVKAAAQWKLPQNYVDMKAEMEARMAELTKAGVHEKPGPHVQQGGDELAALRTYTIPSPLQGQYASADFVLLLGDNRAEDVRWLKGDDVLKKAMPALLAATYRSPLPVGSKAKVLRRGIVACTTGSKTCLLVLLPAGQAQMEN